MCGVIYFVRCRGREVERLSRCLGNRHQNSRIMEKIGDENNTEGRLMRGSCGGGDTTKENDHSEKVSV